MIQVAEAIKQAQIIKDNLHSPEFKAVMEKFHTLNPDSPAEEKVAAVKAVIPYLLPIGEFAKSLLNDKGDATVDQIEDILKAI